MSKRGFHYRKQCLRCFGQMTSENSLLDGIEIVNIVGSGSLGVEIDTAVLSSDLEYPLVNYDEQMGGVFIRFYEGGPLCCIYRSGKYLIRGANSYEELDSAEDSLFSILKERNIISSDWNSNFEIKNIVCVFDSNSQINLNELAIEAGIENIEYEPEQFPGLIYRSEDREPILLAFSSGKIVITGSANHEEVNEILKDIQSFDSI